MERLTSLLYAPLNLFPSATQNFGNKHSQRSAFGEVHCVGSTKTSKKISLLLCDWPIPFCFAAVGFWRNPHKNTSHISWEWRTVRFLPEHQTIQNEQYGQITQRNCFNHCDRLQRCSHFYSQRSSSTRKRRCEGGNGPGDIHCKWPRHCAKQNQVQYLH